MRRFIYHGNFCAECGNPLTPRRRWFVRFLCDECAAQLRRAQRLPVRGWPWVMVVAIIGLFYLFNRSTATTSPAPAPPAAPVALAAPLTTTMSAATPAVIQEPQSVFCSARTKRGTPCRRLVKAPNERCTQHRGQPALARTSKSSTGP